MILDKTCKTCEFNFEGKCGIEHKYTPNKECKSWGASFEYYKEITQKAPWYLKEPYDRYKLNYMEFLDLLQKDEQGIGVEINIYDVIEKIYQLTSEELAGILDVSIGVLGYARTQKTIPKRKRQFSTRLHIPESFFESFMSTRLDELKKCREEFESFYGDELIKKFKQNGLDAMEARMKRLSAIDKIRNEKYREENQERYQYKEKSKMYHDLTDDYKSRDYVIAITLKDGDYYGNIFYEYTSGGYGLSVSTMEDILQFIEELNCEEINELNEEGLLNNNIALRADINGLNIHFELKNDKGEKLEKTISEDELQKYIVGYEKIRCDGHGMKKERRKCNSCENFTPIEGCAKGNCSVRGDVVQRSRIICAHDFVPKTSNL